MIAARTRWMLALGLALASSPAGVAQEAGPSSSPAVLPAGGSVAPAGLAQIQALLSTHRGKPLVLHLFASWCPPCDEEVRELAPAAAALGARVDVVGVAAETLMGRRTPEQEAALSAWLSARGITYPVLLYDDPAGPGLLAALGVRDGVPVTLIYGPDGAPWAIYQRPVRGAEVLDALEVNGVDVAAARAALAAADARRSGRTPAEEGLAAPGQAVAPP